MDVPRTKSQVEWHLNTVALLPAHNLAGILYAAERADAQSFTDLGDAHGGSSPLGPRGGGGLKLGELSNGIHLRNQILTRFKLLQRFLNNTRF